MEIYFDALCCLFMSNNFIYPHAVLWGYFWFRDTYCRARDGSTTSFNWVIHTVNSTVLYVFMHSNLSFHLATSEHWARWILTHKTLAFLNCNWKCHISNGLSCFLSSRAWNFFLAIHKGIYTMQLRDYSATLDIIWFINWTVIWLNTFK